MFPSIPIITAESLGDREFRREYGIRYAYIAGAMYKGIASKELVVALGKAGLMGYFGAGGLELDEIESAIRYIKRELCDRQAFGMNLLCNFDRPELEEGTVDVCLKHDIRFIEAAAYMQITPSIVRYRMKGITEKPDGEIHVPHRILAKISRPEIATLFMQPAPERILKNLAASGHLTEREAHLGQYIPMAHEICVEADSGGHTDRGVAYALMPVILSLRAEMQTKFSYRKAIRVGAAGGIGTPHAAAAAFIMGADFILTGSINQCTVEAGTSNAAKDVLQEVNVQDMTMAPAGDMFELGAKVQVVKRGVLFSARANKLYELYQRYNSIDEIDSKIRQQIEDKYFRRTFDSVWSETKAYYSKAYPGRISDIEANPKQKMSLIFKWYFIHSTRLAMQGDPNQRVDYQIQCGPAMGAFNQWVKGTNIHAWRDRHVADIGERLMLGAARHLQEATERMLESAAKPLRAGLSPARLSV
jgi:trans-AT polyketide synthase, acyltransferase and oxidoreductase domains